MNRLELITQPVKKILMKVERKDERTGEMEEIQGDVLSANLSVRADSAIRRTLSCTLHLRDLLYISEEFGDSWMNQIVTAYYGIWDKSLNNGAGDYEWFPLGEHLLVRYSYSYAIGTQAIELTLADLMSSITQERGNQIGSEVKIEAGNEVTSALTSFIQQFTRFKKIRVCEFDDTVPYDLEFDRGVYPYDVVNKFVSLWTGHEQFVDKDGTFVVQEIPLGHDEENVLTAEEMEQLVISENGQNDLSAIKNVTEIWGKVMDPEDDIDFVPVAVDGLSTPGTYKLTFEAIGGVVIEVLEDGKIFSMVPDVDCVEQQLIQVNDLTPHALVKENSTGYFQPIKAGEMIQGVNYYMRYTMGNFVLLGETEIHGMCLAYNVYPPADQYREIQERYNCRDVRITVSPDSPFGIDKIGERVQVKTGGEFEDIYTSQLAIERAAYEIWKTTRMQDTMSINMLYVPWLDVNQKVEYRTIVKDRFGKKATMTHDYLIQSIDADLARFTMTVNMVRYYPMYPWADQLLTWGEISAYTWEQLSGSYYWAALRDTAGVGRAPYRWNNVGDTWATWGDLFDSTQAEAEDQGPSWYQVKTHDFDRREPAEGV